MKLFASVKMVDRIKHSVYNAKKVLQVCPLETILVTKRGTSHQFPFQESVKDSKKLFKVASV
jgi:hypothetical protein